MSEWGIGTLNDVLVEVDVRNADESVSLVLSVTEGRGVVPQSEVFKKRIATDDTSNYKVVQPLDIAWNPYLLWTGAVGQWLGRAPGVTSPIYPVYRARPDQDGRYWGLVLKSGLLTPYFDSTAVGSIQRRRRTTPPVFQTASVSIPPLADQRRIVDVMAAVDAQIEALGAEIAAATRILDALRADLPEADEVPIASVVVGIDSGKSVQTKGEVPVHGKARVLKLSAVQLGQFDADEAKRLDDPSGYMQTHLVNEGDLLITRSNTPERVGYVAVALDVPPNTYLPDLIWRIHPDESRCLASYLAHMLSSAEMRSRITASASGTSSSMQKINKKGFRAIKVPIPDTIAAQEAYIKKCDSCIDTIGALKAELARIRTFGTALLTSLLNQQTEIPASYDTFLERTV